MVLLRFTKMTVASTAIFLGYHASRKFTKPPRYDFSEKKGKQIVVVGSGMAGLTVAYYLSRNENNSVVILERGSKPY